MDSRGAATARQRGNDFEALFERMAGLQGLLARKIPISGYFQGTNFYPSDSELDWQLIDRRGRVAMLDTKSFEGDVLPRSWLKDHQVRTASTLNDWGVRAGFVVWFRRGNAVVFLTGRQVNAVAEGSLRPEEGLHLGTGFDFDLKKLFDPRIFGEKSADHGVASRHGQRETLERQGEFGSCACGR